MSFKIERSLKMNRIKEYLRKVGIIYEDADDVVEKSESLVYIDYNNNIVVTLETSNVYNDEFVFYDLNKIKSGELNNCLIGSQEVMKRTSENDFFGFKKRNPWVSYMF